MRFEEYGMHYVLRLDPGDEVVSVVRDFCETQGIALAKITGIGATNRAEIGLYDTEEQQYVSKEFTGDHEIASLIGNVTLMDGKPYLHMHAVLGDKMHKAIAGHLTSAVVSATCEIIIEQIEGEAHRKHDDNTGLNIMEF